MKSRRTLGAIVVIVVVVAVSVVGLIYLLPTPEDTIKIGYLCPITGYLAREGEEMKRGVELAEEYINEHGGILGKKVDILIEDTEAKPETAVAAAEKLITRDGVVALAGIYTSSATFAVVDAVVSKYEIPYIGRGWHDNITAMRYKYVFRLGPFTSYLTNTTAEFIASIPGTKTFSGLTSNDDYGVSMQSSIVARLQDLSVTINHDLYHDPAATDFTSELVTIKENEPDVFYSTSSGAAILIMTRQMREIGIHSNFVLYAGAEFWTEEWLDGTEGYGNLAIGGASWNFGINYSEITKEVVERYLEKWENDEPSFYILEAFDTMLAYYYAINNAGSTDSDKIVDALEVVDEIGTRQRIRFVTKGTEGPWYHECAPEWLWFQWQEGKLVCVWPLDLAEGNIIQYPEE